MNQSEIQSSTASREDASAKAHSFIIGPCGVRYQVKDGARSVAFYGQQLGFKVDQQNRPHIRAGLHRPSQTDSQRSWSIRLSSDA